MTNERNPHNERTPSPSGKVPHGFPQEQREKINPPIKANPARFETLVARYYPAIYSLASRLTDDPVEAVLLTHDAFNSTRKQLESSRDEVARVTILLNAVIRAGLIAV